MKEKGIIFNTNMVQAILANKKRMTRRPVKPQPQLNVDMCYNDNKICQKDVCYGCMTKRVHGFKNAPYKVGQVLYVREAWGIGIQLAGGIIYKTDYTDRKAPLADGEKWKSPINMPKAAARIWLKVTGVRTERLQDISREDAIKEGLPAPEMALHFDHNNGLRESFYYKRWFSNSWDSIYAKKDGGIYAWEHSPWVWVYELERIEK